MIIEVLDEAFFDSRNLIVVDYEFQVQFIRSIEGSCSYCKNQNPYKGSSAHSNGCQHLYNPHSVRAIYLIV
jgi:hypothetical protein